MKILGVTTNVPSCSSASLMDEGIIIAGSPEERLNREKNSIKFPSKAIKFCLDQSGLKLSDVNAIAISWNPLINIRESPSDRLFSIVRNPSELIASISSNIMKLHDDEPTFMKQSIFYGDCEIDLYYINHHLCHAATSYYQSGFKEAIIITCDGYGENETITVSIGKNNKINKVSSTYFPNSLGMFYGAITEYLGFKHDSDEWKVMALGALGELDTGLYNKLRCMFIVNDDLTISFDTKYFRFNNALLSGMYSESFVDYLCIQERKYGDDYLKEHYNLAFATQKVFEDIVFDLSRQASSKYNINNICLGGGSFMNSLFNGKMAMKEFVNNLYIPYSPNDAGNSIGASLYVYHNILDYAIPERSKFCSPYLGPEYSNEYIKKILELFNCKYEYFRSIEPVAAKLIFKGNIIGWFQGKMEFGERALGNRSILADPTNNQSKEKVNKIIKFREGYRPFAPAVLDEFVSDFFDLPVKAELSYTPYMEKVFSIKKEMREKLPGVCHNDGTGRIQSVKQNINQRFYNLISEFSSLSSVPIVMNTSLNRNGEPIVINNYLVSKI